MSTPAGENVQDTPDRIVLESPNDSVKLMELVPEDAEELFALIAFDPDHLRQHGEDTADKYQDVESLRQSILHPVDPNRYRFGIWDNGIIVGSDNLTLKGDGIAALGSWIGKQYIGRGYAGRGRSLLLDFAFNTLGLNLVYSSIAVGNDASRRSVEKSGLKFAGIYVDDDTGTHRWRYELKKEDYEN